MLHSLKPLGYVRYGDDFVLWFQDEYAAKKAQVIGTQFLADELYLQINSKHDLVQPVYKKLSYLGVDIWSNGSRLASKTSRRIQQRLGLENMASYQTLVRQNMPSRYHKRFLWQTIDIITKLL